MITIFHGINTPASRKAFIDARGNAQSPVTMDGTKLTLSDLAQVLSGEALFASEQYLFIEEFYSKRKKSNETDALANFILEHEKDNKIFIWESKELTAKQASTFKGAQTQKFDLPKHIFAFLESLLPHNSNKAIELFHKTLETEDAEFIFFMMVRHFRILLAVSDTTGQAEAIDEVKRMAPWLKGKTAKQANSFSTSSLRNFYNNLFTIEAGLKTGGLATSLIQAIDFLLLSL